MGRPTTRGESEGDEFPSDAGQTWISTLAHTDGMLGNGGGGEEGMGWLRSGAGGKPHGRRWCLSRGVEG